MTDYTELKRLAEAAQYENHEFQRSLVTATRKFFEGCIPEQILELIVERDQLKAEVEALRKDAERYRHVRDGAFVVATMEGLRIFCEELLLGPFAEASLALDVAIDAAMSKEAGHD